MYFGLYQVDEDFPTGLYRTSLEDWDRLASRAILNGAEVFTLIRTSHNSEGLL